MNTSWPGGRQRLIIIMVIIMIMIDNQIYKVAAAFAFQIAKIHFIHR